MASQSLRKPPRYNHQRLEEREGSGARGILASKGGLSPSGPIEAAAVKKLTLTFALWAQS